MSEETSKITPITEKKIKEASMSTLPTRPNSNGLYGETKLTPQELKARMDALPLLALEKINEIINGMGADGAVAKTIKFKNGDDEYSLAELFAMIFSPEGLSDILMTNVEAGEGGERTSLPLNNALNNIMYSASLLKDDVNLVKKSKPIALSTNELDDSKLPTKIYYKVIEPEWVNTVAVTDKSKSYDVYDIKHTEQETIVPVPTYWAQLLIDITIPENTYYTVFAHSYDYSTQEHLNEKPEIVSDGEIICVDENNKVVIVSTEMAGYGGCEFGESNVYLTTFRYEDGSPVTAPLTLYPAEIMECYDFENLQFTTEAEGNTLLGDVYSYVDEWGNRCYTLYPDYTPNIKEGTSAISLAVSDVENMLYSIKLEALFNGGYKFSFASKDAAFLTGIDVVADGDGAVSSGRETIVIGNSANGFGTLNMVRAQTGTAIGYKNIVTGRHGIAFIEGNKVLGYGAIGLGDHNTLCGTYDIVGGWQNKSFGHANFIQGGKNVLNGKYLVGFGSNNAIKGEYDIVQGLKNIVEGNYNNVNGYSNKILGNNNIVNGILNIIESTANEVLGSENFIIAGATSNIVNGQKNRINAPEAIRNFINGVNNQVEVGVSPNLGYNVLVGRDIVCKSTYGNGFGQGLIIDSGYGNQLVIGKFNEVDRYARFIIGNGTSDAKRSNAFVVKNDGRAVLGADPEENMDAVTKQYLDKALKNYVGNDMIGDIESALDAIIQIQNGIIGGETA